MRLPIKFRALLIPFAAALLLYGFLPLRAQEVITVDPNAPAKPFPHFWEQMFGSGRAVLSMRASYRDDLRATQRITGLQFVRFHGIFNDEMGVYNQDAQGNPAYNFSYVDQVYDGLLALGVKPFVELGFMPRELAANPTPHPFWYKPFPSPPKDPARWTALITAFVNHLIERYGKSEVESWYFEVWNEPNIDFWNGVPKEQTYYALYDETVRAIKAIDPHFRVGGPATAQAAWVDRFIAHCLQNHVPFDFVSSHIYGNEKPEDIFGKHLNISQRDMVGLAVKKVYDQVKASAAPATPIIWSEYNATYMNLPSNTDSAFMGPWLANNIRECDGRTSMMSYWTFSDVFEEQGIVKTPFYGGFGLIAEREIPKAAFRAFELLHQLGNQRLPSTSENALLTKANNGTVVLALWNYAGPDASAPPRSFQLKASTYKSYSIQIVGPQYGSSLEKWRAMGEPKYPSLRQIQKLKQDSNLPPAEQHQLSDPVKLPAHTLALVKLEP